MTTLSTRSTVVHLLPKNLISHVDGIKSLAIPSFTSLLIRFIHHMHSYDVNCYYVVSFIICLVSIQFKPTTYIRHYGRVVKATDLN